jgi:hypothetical protein
MRTKKTYFLAAMKTTLSIFVNSKRNDAYTLTGSGATGREKGLPVTDVGRCGVRAA